MSRKTQLAQGRTQPVRQDNDIKSEDRPLDERWRSRDLCFCLLFVAIIIWLIVVTVFTAIAYNTGSQVATAMIRLQPALQQLLQQQPPPTTMVPS